MLVELLSSDLSQNSSSLSLKLEEAKFIDQWNQMMKDQRTMMIRPWFLDVVPLMVVILITAHVLALVYWIYRVATERQPPRRKAH